MEKAGIFITYDETSQKITGIINGKIDTDLFGTPFYGDARMSVPEDATIMIGDKLSFYHDWVRKTDRLLVDEGQIRQPRGYTFEGDTLRQMNNEERKIAGLDPLDAGTKIEDGKIVSMSLDERHDAGIVSDADYLETVTAEVNGELNRRIAALNTEEIKAQAEIDGEYAAVRKTKLAALLAVKKQEGWPLDVEWPEE
ncbi:hypothetical protein FACS189494_05160 [Spirochaetia bacterium]|nr:hypothetical protein FACS189494_05160 [Spirochaetia bacterium]